MLYTLNGIQYADIATVMKVKHLSRFRIKRDYATLKIGREVLVEVDAEEFAKESVFNIDSYIKMLVPERKVKHAAVRSFSAVACSCGSEFLKTKYGTVLVCKLKSLCSNHSIMFARKGIDYPCMTIGKTIFVVEHYALPGSSTVITLY